VPVTALDSPAAVHNLASKSKTMYKHLFHFFGLRENPFHVSPDPRFFLSTRAHGSAFAELKLGVDTRQGFIALIGEAGTGKTILLHHFLNWLQGRHQSSCYIFQSQLKPLELFESILHDFGVRCDSRRKGDLLAGLNQWLVRRHAMGDSPVLIIDEAQSISLRTLDRLRLLLNMEAPGSKLLQIVLAGQPELEDKLRRPELRQLHQRIMFRCTLVPLSMEETAEYVKSRLASGGANDTGIFSDESLEAVHMYAQGIPRVVNLLCEHALLAAYAEKRNVIATDMISRVATAFELTSQLALPSEQEILPRFGQRDPLHTDKKTSGIVSEIAVLTEQKIEVKRAPLAAISVKEKKPEVRPKPEPTLLAREPILLAAAAAGASAIVSTPKPQVAATPIIARTAPKLPEQQATSNKLPTKGKRPTLGAQFLYYCREVEQSFVRDWRQFLRTYAQAKKVPGSGSPSP
jgi:general secretion pathway protein A